MEPTEWQMRPYLQEVVNQAEAAMVNARYLNAAMRDDSPYALMEAFAAAQGILTAAGQVHQLLWVNHGSLKPRAYADMDDAGWEKLKAFSRARAKRLRRVLKAGDASPLKSRAVRNSFEHFDARLDRHMVVSRLPLFDRIIGDPKTHMEVGDLTESQFLRLINPKGLVVTVLGDSVGLQAVCEELARLGVLARRRLSPGVR